MAGRKPTIQKQLSMLEVRTKTAPCVPAIRTAVYEWQKRGYPGVTDTTRRLLNHWFINHRLRNGKNFRYHRCQQDAVETIVYLYEVAKIRRHKDLLEKFSPPDVPDLRLLQYDDFTRYCIKMATGSGKTKVMSLLVAWQYFNAILEGKNDYAKVFLIIAPNVIVFERLKTDFQGGHIFADDPIIPPDFKIYWNANFDFYVRGDTERASSQGALYLTNIQQFYDRSNNDADKEPEPMTSVLGPRPPVNKQEIDDFDKRIAERSGHCMIINDEAHHTHDEGSQWNEIIRKLHSQIPGGLCSQMDFSATPRYSKGSLFTWTVYDYPLKQAILDNIVKRPIKGIATGIEEARSDIASTRYAAYLAAGVERWREYQERLKSLARKPILFIMMNSTNDAEDVASYLRDKYPESFAGDKLQVIHTDKTGEVSKAELDKARTIVRQVDSLDNPVNCIVSVLMLREGWDVQNVTVVVGLRPYSAKANILPEQTIGRGLRLMFRDLGTAYTERVDVIGNKAFIEFVEQLEKDEDMQLGTFRIGEEKLVIVVILPDPTKLDKDISLPILSPILSRKKSLAEEIANLNVSSLNCPILPVKSDDAAAKTFRYEGYDIITLQKLIERDYTIPEAQTAQEVISYYAKRIAQDVKLPSQFSILAPKLREFFENNAFGRKVNLDTPVMVKAIGSNVAQYVTVKTFDEALRSLVVEELEPKLINQGRKLSETLPFPYSRPTYSARKCVFNLVPCDNEFEKAFAKFLEKASDVDAFSKLPEQFGFAIEYTDSVSNLRYYQPDFAAILSDGVRYLIETKGREDVDVAHKDRAAQIWCQNASFLTGTAWEYIKVPQKEFDKLEPSQFSDLLVFANAKLI